MTEQSIDIFLAVVRTGSISGAAQSLYITQPAVSRHIRDLETEMGCTLIQRNKGIRHIVLTQQGEAFLAMSRRWKVLCRETKEIATMKDLHLNLSSIGSISTYLLPDVIHRFISEYPEITFHFHNQHSLDAYRYMENGSYDLALISDDMYYKGVETIPAFREPMVLLAPKKDWKAPVHPTQLNPLEEIRLPWNPEYDAWHDYWFAPTAHPRAAVDQMSLLEEFLSWGNCWAVAPASAAKAIAGRNPVKVYELQNGPSPRIIYYLQSPYSSREPVQAFLTCLKKSLGNTPELECLL